jgi:hypothetical protein
MFQRDKDLNVLFYEIKTCIYHVDAKKGFKLWLGCQYGLSKI